MTNEKNDDVISHMGMMAKRQKGKISKIKISKTDIIQM
jgi:hypothetical protein